MTHAAQLKTESQQPAEDKVVVLSRRCISLPTPWKKRKQRGAERPRQKAVSHKSRCGFVQTGKGCRGQHISMTDLFYGYSRGADHQRLLITVIKKNVLYDGENHRHQQITPDKQREREDADKPSEGDLFSVNQSSLQSILPPLETFICSLYVLTWSWMIGSLN